VERLVAFGLRSVERHFDALPREPELLEQDPHLERVRGAGVVVEG